MTFLFVVASLKMTKTSLLALKTGKITIDYTQYILKMLVLIVIPLYIYLQFSSSYTFCVSSRPEYCYFSFVKMGDKIVDLSTHQNNFEFSLCTQVIIYQWPRNILMTITFVCLLILAFFKNELVRCLNAVKCQYIYIFTFILIISLYFGKFLHI